MASAEEGEGHVRNESNISRRNPNLRGIAEVLAFAAFLRGMYAGIRLLNKHTLDSCLLFHPARCRVGQNHWAKEFVIVFGDGYADGLEAFLAAYHGTQKLGMHLFCIVHPKISGPILNPAVPSYSFLHQGSKRRSWHSHLKA